MDNKTDVVICLGSSCFARGNKNFLPVIQGYIKENNYEGKVNFRGTHCCGKCIKGPILKIGEKYFERLDDMSLPVILNHELT
jgi:NADH:ubiquinone oxidoreductase subunit E